ncbi:MAG: hypothetical protein ACRDKS_14900 [Actinomycetota bacterium]
MRAQISARAKTRLGIACVVVSLAFIAFWFIGQEASYDQTLDVPDIVANLYPGTWPPIARGILWLFVGATAVGFDLAVMYPRAESRAGRTAVAVLAAMAGASFFAFAIGSFAGAPWSVIH